MGLYKNKYKKEQDKFGLCFAKMSYYISHVYRQKKKNYVIIY